MENALPWNRPNRRRAAARWKRSTAMIAAFGLLPILAGMFGGCRSPGAPPAAETAAGGATGFPDGVGLWQEFRPAEPDEPASPPAIAPSRPRPPAGVRYAQVSIQGRYLALTFDDGPNPSLTPRLLDILKEHGVKATFFVVGRQVAANPEIVERLAAEGHEIGNHSWDHSSLENMRLESVRDQLVRTNNIIRAVAGHAPVLMRPPYGRTNSALNRWIRSDLEMAVVMWSVDPLDWRHKDPVRVRREILSKARPGAIVLAHDSQPATVEAMPEVLAGLLRDGFTFVTVSELIALSEGGSE